MPSYKNVQKESVLKAIKSSFGITSTVAARLACDWGTADRLIHRWEETKNAFDDETKVVLDIAEGKVIKAINEGDIATAKWYLSKKGKERGYEDVPTIKLDNGEPLNIKFEGLTKSQVEDASNIEIGGADESTDI